MVGSSQRFSLKTLSQALLLSSLAAGSVLPSLATAQSVGGAVCGHSEPLLEQSNRQNLSAVGLMASTGPGLRGKLLGGFPTFAQSSSVLPGFVTVTSVGGNGGPRCGPVLGSATGNPSGNGQKLGANVMTINLGGQDMWVVGSESPTGPKQLSVFDSTLSTAPSLISAPSSLDSNTSIFGRATATGNIIDNVGNPDIIVGNIDDFNRGAVALYDGNATLRDTVLGPAATATRFGWAVAVVGDINNDGLDDFAVGSPEEQGATFTRRGGCVRFYGWNGNAVQQIGPATCKDGFTDGLGFDDSGRYGASMTAVGDMTGDGRPDLAVGSPYAWSGNGPTATIHVGKVEILQINQNGTTVSYQDPMLIGSQSDEMFGFSLATVRKDPLITQLLIGTPGWTSSAPSAQQSAGISTLYHVFASQPPVIFSSYVVAGENTLASHGQKVTGGVDIDGDGNPEYAQAEPHRFAPGSEGGRALVFSSPAFTQPGASTGQVRLLGSPCGYFPFVPPTLGASNPTVGSNGLPKLGQPVEIVVSQVPVPGPGESVVVGLWGGYPLSGAPINYIPLNPALPQFFPPGCGILLDHIIGAAVRLPLDPSTGAFTTARTTLQVPNNPGLLGFEVATFQAVVLKHDATGDYITTTNAFAVTVGQ